MSLNCSIRSSPVSLSIANHSRQPSRLVTRLRCDAFSHRDDSNGAVKDSDPSFIRKTSASVAAFVATAALLAAPQPAMADLVQVCKAGNLPSWLAFVRYCSRGFRRPARGSSSALPSYTPPSNERCCPRRHAACRLQQYLILPIFPPQTVPASSVTEYAKPMKKQYIDKGKVWLVFVGGAALLFMTTVLAENNEKWFPAIARANKAMQDVQEAAGEPPVQPLIEAEVRFASVHAGSLAFATCELRATRNVLQRSTTRCVTNSRSQSTQIMAGHYGWRSCQRS